MIAVDGGAEVGEALGLDPEVVIGDMDSLRPAQRDLLASRGVAEHRFPPDKDATDLELALDLAHRRWPEHRLVVLGGGGGRFDHLVVNLAVLSGPLVRSAHTTWLTIDAHVTILRGPAEARFHLAEGELVSLLAMHGRATGVTTRGLSWPLDRAELHSGSGLGLSNVATRDDVHGTAGAGAADAGGPGPADVEVSVALAQGVLTVIRPLG